MNADVEVFLDQLAQRLGTAPGDCMAIMEEIEQLANLRTRTNYLTAPILERLCVTADQAADILRLRIQEMETKGDGPHYTRTILRKLEEALSLARKKAEP